METYTNLYWINEWDTYEVTYIYEGVSKFPQPGAKRNPHP
jgi:hypothetical protein